MSPELLITYQNFTNLKIELWASHHLPSRKAIGLQKSAIYLT
jgi:hypothetical protein